MANARGRGGTSQDAHAVLTAATEGATNTITLSTAGHPDPIVLKFSADRLGEQSRLAVWAMIPHARQGGRWASQATIKNGVRILDTVNESLRAGNIAGFDDPTLSFAHIVTARDLIGERWRSGRAVIAWALRSYHPDGDSLAEHVLDDRLEVGLRPPTMAYDEATARTIENAARKHFLDRFHQHKQALHHAGIDTTDPAWLSLTADEIVAAARRSGSPTALGLERYLDTATIDPDVADVVSVHPDDLAAAMVLLTLAQNLGPNLAALQSMTSRSIAPVGAAGAVVDMTKARAHTSMRVASSSVSLHTFGGLTMALVAITRFARAHRERTATTPQERRHAELLFVAAGQRHVFDGPGDTAWGRSLSREICEGVSTRRLRETANIRGKRTTGRGTVIGHSEKTNRVYLAEGMPENELARLVIEAQDDIVARARLTIRRDPRTDTDQLATIAGATPDQLVDRGVATCANAAIDPATDQRCNRGILGCFTCPSGYRTDVNIPGLKATIALTESIRTHDPDEWLNGPASTLHTYALAALDQFGSDHASVGIDSMLPVVAALYNEVRG